MSRRPRGLEAAGSSADVEFIPAGDFAVADYAGKPLVVNCFGSWCPPCNLEAPALSAFAASDPEAQIVGIAVDTEEGDVVTFMNKYGLAYPVVLDDGWNIANGDGVSGVPTTDLLRRGGQGGRSHGRRRQPGAVQPQLRQGDQ